MVQASGRHGPSPQAETEDTAGSACQQDPDLGHSGPALPVQLHRQEVGLSQEKALASPNQTCESLGRTNPSEALGPLVSP